jgi:hypothetical protein
MLAGVLATLKFGVGLGFGAKFRNRLGFFADCLWDYAGKRTFKY